MQERGPGVPLTQQSSELVQEAQLLPGLGRVLAGNAICSCRAGILSCHPFPTFSLFPLLLPPCSSPTSPDGMTHGSRF